MFKYGRNRIVRKKTFTFKDKLQTVSSLNLVLHFKHKMGKQMPVDSCRRHGRALGCAVGYWSLVGYAGRFWRVVGCAGGYQRAMGWAVGYWWVLMPVEGHRGSLWEQCMQWLGSHAQGHWNENILCELASQEWEFGMCVAVKTGARFWSVCHSL